MKQWVVRSGFGLACAVVLVGCQGPVGPEQPFGAPPPDHSRMTLVDNDGCRWWVIGNAMDLSWAPQTDQDGKHVCEATGTAGGALAASSAPQPATAPPAEAPVSFAVQVATFANPQNAQAAKANFARIGLPVADEPDAGVSDRFYRLVLGPFATSESASDALSRAKTEGFADAFVKRN